MKLDARLDAASDLIVSGRSVPRIARWLAPFSLALVDVGVAVIGLLLGLPQSRSSAARRLTIHTPRKVPTPALQPAPGQPPQD